MFGPAKSPWPNSFADQAVIAIENARLFNEVQAKTRDLPRRWSSRPRRPKSSRSSPLRRPTCGRCSTPSRAAPANVCGEAASSFYRTASSYSARITKPRRIASLAGGVNAHHPQLGHRRAPRRPHASPCRRSFQDIAAEPRYSGIRASACGHRTVLSVPLLRDGEPIGVIIAHANRFAPVHRPQIDLLKTFADQAVIAIDNVRLFDEVQARTRDLPKRCNSRPRPPKC